MASKHFLNNITIPSPCSADWNSMTGNDQVRFCGHCNLNVHDLSQMTRAQAQRLITGSKGRLCARYYRDPLGQPFTLPVSQKVHHIRRRVSRIAAGAFTATLSVTSALAQSSQDCPSGNCNLPAASQTNRWGLGGSIAGTINDPNGDVIPGATISVWNHQTNVRLYASTDQSGEFRFEGLATGIYRIRIEAPGFAAQEGEAYIESSESRFDRNLEVASIEENVDVERGEAVEVATGGVIAFVAPEHPFVKAAQEDNLETVNALLHQVDVNLRDPRTHTTALEHAVQNANSEMVQTLLSAGANVNAKNPYGQTVLMMLDGDATSDLVWELINAGAKVNTTDDNGSTPLMHMASNDNVVALKTLMDAGAEVDFRNEGGVTALMFAAISGSVNVVRELVVAGADINAADKQRKNPLWYAANNNHKRVVRFLKARGAVEIVVEQVVGPVEVGPAEGGNQ
ncbi:MAG TPA: ankyrin repeat domain-containing protein [Pyrinomonadaceae bacterium]|nr:ankyrin repeat domain-containing protein [Pyrinomonadaceae bacterium]